MKLLFALLAPLALGAAVVTPAQVDTVNLTLSSQPAGHNNTLGKRMPPRTLWYAEWEFLWMNHVIYVKDYEEFVRADSGCGMWFFNSLKAHWPSMWECYYTPDRRAIKMVFNCAYFLFVAEKEIMAHATGGVIDDVQVQGGGEYDADWAWHYQYGNQLRNEDMERWGFGDSAPKEE